jgi:DNA-binding MarR family transcriptional regulator
MSELENIQAKRAELIPPTKGSPELASLVKTFRRWLFLPDPASLLAVLGAYAANRLEGDPVWLLLVGSPGAGKSETIGSLAGLPDVHPAATMTEASLLSGTPKKERAENASGGLLRKIGDQGILLCKDFGSVLSMHRDERARVLAALREIYDGSWTRHVGVDGGRSLHWKGRVGLIAGCTPTIDRHHAVMGAMGERFVLFRLPETDPADLARRSLRHAGREVEMRKEMANAVDQLFARDFGQPRALSDEDEGRLIALSTLVVRARSAVERDSYHSRDIELIPAPEAPTRLIVVLKRLLDGLDAIGCDREEAWDVVIRSALDSMPAIRRSVLDLLIDQEAAESTSQIAEALGYPTTTTKRALEDLTAHGLVSRTSQGQGKADLWELAPWARKQYAAVRNLTRKVVLSGEGDIKSVSAHPDISGEVGR